MKELGKKEFFFSIEKYEPKNDLFLLVVNINGTSFSNYETPINLPILINDWLCCTNLSLKAYSTI
ncbi:hypothetical protein [Acinetobacter baumannii]|uniref:hypothetical protein n=1 Tax=Acinetobacter baumannii TaxID=470 RepID=UPI000709D497|nr:hypothetical protein [Acinetobacter baumannii]KRJ96151.1 hypothetical protein APC98_04665 [Acinetobacter baumannii]